MKTTKISAPTILLTAALLLGLAPATDARAQQTWRSDSRSPVNAHEQSAPQASILVNIFDGDRKPVAAGSQVLIRLFDGNHRQVVSGFYKGPSVRFNGVPVYDNFGDDYIVFVARKGHKDAGTLGVHVAPGVVQVVNLMLVPNDSVPQYSAAHWQELEQRYPQFWRIIAAGADGETAQQRYEALLRDDPLAAACLLNLLTASAQFVLPSGTTPLPYMSELIFDETMEQDRFFVWVDQRLLDQLRQGEELGMLERVAGAAFFHPGATDSWKQVQLDQANLHFTFHGGERRVIGGVQCIKMELDIDYFKDKIAHTFGELIPNMVTGALTDPRTVYELRWNAGQAAHFLPFEPPYTLEAKGAHEPRLKVEHKRRNLHSLMRHAW